jgi:hypothetical protein
MPSTTTTASACRADARASAVILSLKRGNDQKELGYRIADVFVILDAHVVARPASSVTSFITVLIWLA